MSFILISTVQAVTTIVASVIHESYIGVDTTRKLTIPHAAKLPPAASAALRHPAHATIIDEDSGLQAAGLLGSNITHEGEAALAAPVFKGRTCLNEAETITHQKGVTDQVKLAAEQTALVDLAEQDSGSADTSHHAAVAQEAPQEASRGGRPEGTVPAERSQAQQAARSAALSQHQAPMSDRIGAGRRMLRAGQPQLTLSDAGLTASRIHFPRQQSKAASFGTREAAGAGAQRIDSVQNGPSPKTKPRPSLQRADPFEAFRFKPAAEATPAGMKCCTVV